MPTPELPAGSDVAAPDLPVGHRAVRMLLAERWDILVVISAGGAIGSLIRWFLAEIVPHGSHDIAWSTLTANVTGALLLGVLMAGMLDLLATTRYVRPFLGIGVLGGYTTFSTYMLDTRALLVAGEPYLALTYVAGTLIIGLVAVWLGLVCGRALIALATRRAGRRRGHEVSDRSRVDSTTVDQTDLATEERHQP